MSDARNPVLRTRLLALVVLIVVFFAGALAGAAYVRVAHNMDRHPRSHESRGHRHRHARLFSADGPLGQRLNLTAEQRARIEAILHEDSASTDSLLRTMRPVLKAHFDSTATAIRAVLTPEQRAEFEHYRKERRREMVRKSRDQR